MCNDSGPYLDEACLRFIEGTESVVPAERLAQVLEGIQTSVLLLAATAEERVVDKRFKPTAELRQHYEVVCLTPERGSYSMPIRLRDTRTQPGLDSPPLLDRAAQVLEAVASGSERTLADLVPDSVIRQKLLRELARFLPRTGSSWQLEYRHADSVIALGQRAQRTAEAWARAPEEQTTMAVIGYLVRVDFEEHKVVIRLPATSRTIDCFARPEVVDDLVDNRQDPVQVTGVFTLDEQDNPIKLTDVSSIESVDVSPMVLDAVPLGDDRWLVPKGAVGVKPELDDTMQLFVVEDADLELHLEASTREDLFEDLLEELGFLWAAYAHAEDDDLAPSAMRLKTNLLERFEEKTDVLP